MVPTSSKVPKIEKVVLFNRGVKDPNKAHYSDTLIAQAHCIGMFGQTVEFTLWEDDAKGDGHNPTVNKDNALPTKFYGKINKNGIAEAKISLASNKNVLMAIANRHMMAGQKSEGKDHEYYVTATYNGKIKGASKVNVDVANPDYRDKTKPATPISGKSQPPVHKPQTAPPQKTKTKSPAKPKEHSAIFPGTSPKPARKAADKLISHAYFVDLKGNPVNHIKMGDSVKVRIKTENMLHEWVEYVIWEYDTGQKIFDDEIFRGKFQIKGDAMESAIININKSSFENGFQKDLYAGDDGKQQEYYIEVVPLTSKVNSKSFGLDNEMKQTKVDSGVSPAVVKKEKLPLTEKSKCFCNRDFTEDEVKKFVKLLKGKEQIWERKSCHIEDKSFKSLTSNLNTIFKKYNINTCIRKIHFLSQACEETGVFGLAEEEPSEYKSSQSKYKGRGIIQLTGDRKKGEEYYNQPGSYQEYADYIGNKEIVTNPTIVATNIIYCVDSAGWEWGVNKKAPKFKDSNKDSAAIKERKAKLREKYKEILGKSPNEIADYIDKYQLEIGKIINGFHDGTDPNGQTTRKLYYNILKENFFEFRKYHENANNKQEENIEGGIVTYHIFSDGKIEKHIPQEISSKDKDKYKYNLLCI